MSYIATWEDTDNLATKKLLFIGMERPDKETLKRIGDLTGKLQCEDRVVFFNYGYFVPEHYVIFTKNKNTNWLEIFVMVKTVLENEFPGIEFQF